MTIARELWPIYRTVTGPGFDESLKIIQRSFLPNLRIKSTRTGSKVFDWTIPDEYSVLEAWIETPSGEKICNFAENNLHLVGFSEAIDTRLPLSELQTNLHSLPDQPNAVPYVTSYYRNTWGFCISHKDRLQLEDGEYRVYINARKFPGFLRYGELLIKGESKKEILLTSYLCHPSMANNELSGPIVLSKLAQNLLQRNDLKFSYRILLLPETIGSIAYIKKNLRKLNQRLKLFKDLLNDLNVKETRQTLTASNYAAQMTPHLCL